MKQVLLALSFAGALITSPLIMAEEASAPVATTIAVSASAVTAPSVDAVVPSVDAVAAEALPVAAPPALDKGDTAWVLTATALVLFMTIPGLALFYGGMVRKKNVLATMMHSLTAAAVVTVVWVVIGYSLAFGNGVSESWAPYIGGFDRILYQGVDVAKIWVDANGLAYTIPESLFMIFQMTFAIITVAIMAGAFAERMKFSAFLVFVALWVVFVYAPIAHSVWHAKGFLFAEGALDFAGGTVVHINAGIAGLVAAYMIGRRVGYGKEPMAPHNLTMTVVGAGMLWVGWFGFNAGSWLGADGRAAPAQDRSRRVALRWRWL